MIKPFWLWKLARGVIRHIPLSLLVPAARILAIPLAFFFKMPHHSYSLLKKPFGWKDRLAAGYLRSTGSIERKIWRSKFNITNISERVGLQNEEHFDMARRSHRGILFVSLHCYYFRLFQYWINQADPALKPYLIKFFPSNDSTPPEHVCHREQQAIFNQRLISAHGSMKKTVRVLKEGGSVIICQDVLSPRCEPVLFLGQSIRNPLGAARLSEMSDALIVPLMITGTIHARHCWAIHFWPPIDPRNGDSREKLIASLEEIIQTYPAMWNEWAILT